MTIDWSQAIYDQTTKVIKNLIIDGIQYSEISPKILLNPQIWDNKEHSIDVDIIQAKRPTTLQEKWNLLQDNKTKDILSDGINAVDIDWNGVMVNTGTDSEYDSSSYFPVNSTSDVIKLLNDLYEKTDFGPMWGEFTCTTVSPS